jgi:TRAP-type C4-dicarboxylate transport system permease small subunit
MRLSSNPVGTRVEFRQLFGHVLMIFLLALVGFGCAIGLAIVERHSETLGLPSWLTLGMGFVSMCLFVVDSILVIGASVITTIKILIKLTKEQL